MKKISEQTYPDYFPEGCPPDDAIVSERILYRFCKKDKPEENDFISCFEFDSKNGNDDEEHIRKN